MKFSCCASTTQSGGAFPVAAVHRATTAASPLWRAAARPPGGQNLPPLALPTKACREGIPGRADPRAKVKIANMALRLTKNLQARQ
jgi:hypothetical protein